MVSNNRNNKAWDDISEWIDISRDILNNNHGCIRNHEDHNIIILLITNCNELCMKENGEYRDEYF